MQSRLLLVAAMVLASAVHAQDEAPDDLGPGSPPPASADPADAGGGDAALSPREVADRILPSVVTVIVERDDESISQGSGFFIGKRLIVTNYHVIKYGRFGDFKFAGEKKLHEIQGVVAIDERSDLAVLKVRSRDVKGKPLKLAKRRPRAGDRIYVAGTPQGLEATFSDGLVSGIRGKKKEFVQITAPVSRGSSGGPVVNERGEVVGVVALKAKGGESLNFAVSANKLRKMLKDRHKVVKLRDVEDFLDEQYEDEYAKRPRKKSRRRDRYEDEYDDEYYDDGYYDDEYYDDGYRSGGSDNTVLYVLLALFLAPPLVGAVMGALGVAFVCIIYVCVFAVAILSYSTTGFALLGTGALAGTLSMAATGGLLAMAASSAQGGVQRVPEAVGRTVGTPQGLALMAVAAGGALTSAAMLGTGAYFLGRGIYEGELDEAFAAEAEPEAALPEIPLGQGPSSGSSSSESAGY